MYGQHMLLCGLMPALVLAHLTLILPYLLIKVEVLPGNSKTLLFANKDIFSEQVMIMLSRPCGATERLSSCAGGWRCLFSRVRVPVGCVP